LLVRPAAISFVATAAIDDVYVQTKDVPCAGLVQEMISYGLAK